MNFFRLKRGSVASERASEIHLQHLTLLRTLLRRHAFYLQWRQACHVAENGPAGRGILTE